MLAPQKKKNFLCFDEKTVKNFYRNSYNCLNCMAYYKQKDASGKDIGYNKVGLDIFRVIREIRLEPSVEVLGRKKKITGYGFHSLRHSFASHCAEAGVLKAVSLSILGTDSNIANKYHIYIREETQMKAIAAVASITTQSDRQRIEEALKLLDTPDVPVEKILNRVRHVLKA